MADSDTRSRILDAATHLFLQQGYGGTSLEQVAAQAGVTKPTVYSHFGSKQGLLRAMTHRQTQKRLEEFVANLQSGGDPRAELTRFAKVFLSRVLTEEARSWQRLATAESDRYPEVGEAFFESGPRRVFQHLTKYLRQEKTSGRLSIQHPERAAEQFLGMLLGIDLMRSLVGQPLPAKSQLDRRCKETVDLFLRVYEAQPESLSR